MSLNVKFEIKVTALVGMDVTRSILSLSLVLCKKVRKAFMKTEKTFKCIVHLKNLYEILLEKQYFTSYCAIGYY